MSGRLISAQEITRSRWLRQHSAPAAGGGLAALALVAFRLLERAGVEPGTPPAETLDDMLLFAGLGMLFFVTLLASVYDS